jgi:phytoene dehydrogenase-like protein
MSVRKEMDEDKKVMKKQEMEERSMTEERQPVAKESLAMDRSSRHKPKFEGWRWRIRKWLWKKLNKPKRGRISCSWTRVPWMTRKINILSFVVTILVKKQMAAYMSAMSGMGGMGGAMGGMGRVSGGMANLGGGGMTSMGGGGMTTW